MKHIVYFTFVFTILLSGCGTTDKVSGKTIDQIMDKYPKVAEELKVFSDEDLDRILIPKHIPFEVEDIEAVAYPGESLQVELIFSKGAMNLHVMTMEGPDSAIPQNGTMAQLENGDNALYDTNEFGKVLQWSDQQHEGFYTIKLMTYKPEQEMPYTKQDILKVANSIYKQEPTSL